ncbi:tubulin PhuZ [Pseudomonas phage Psa21]|uniref:PhuZ n=1 Tax=Pseudomonas phage Psa21 TaxID=2530023 RepID=A0A481W5K4_9CAUD|nr:tubulin PhuZ [Pseudomonas phage Psa21]QBJ02557.1 PhuZ [Pseudomonas phage Psa21]
MSDIKTRIYNCGGTGFNIGSLYGATAEHVCFLDSSDANLKDKQIPAERVYLIPGTDGAGGDQSYMMPFARKHADEMLKKFEPGATNIIVVGAGGGSGVAIAVQIATKLLTLKLPTIIIGISGTDSTRRIRNTTNFIKNMEVVSLKTQQPVVLAWVENTNGEAEADQEVLFLLDALVVLTDQTNGRLDTKDIINWLQYQHVCSVSPQLVQLHVSENRAEAAAVMEPISVASLYTDAEKNIPFGSAFVRTVGITNNDAKMPSDQLHFVINSVGINSITEKLEQERVKLNTVQSGFRQRKPVVSIDDNLTEDGYVVD